MCEEYSDQAEKPDRHAKKAARCTMLSSVSILYGGFQALLILKSHGTMSRGTESAERK